MNTSALLPKYIDRLYEEWKQHKNIIIGLDFDDTIYPYRENFSNTDMTISLVKEAQKVGATVIVYTGSSPDRYDFIRQYCQEKGLRIDGINENVITPFGDNRKIYANIYLDDRAGIFEAMEILGTAMWKIKGDLHSEQEMLNQF